MGSIPLSISGFGSGHSLLSAVTIDDHGSTNGGNLGCFLPRTINRDWKFGSKSNLTAVQSRNSLGKFSGSISDLHSSARFHPDIMSAKQDDPISVFLKGRLASPKMPSTMPLPMPTRKASNNQLGLNMPTRKASLYNMTSKNSFHNATFQNVNSLPATTTNAKFDLITGTLSAGSKTSLFPQVHKAAASPSLPATSTPALDLSNEIFVVLSPTNAVSRPKISQDSMDGIKSFLESPPLRRILTGKSRLCLSESHPTLNSDNATTS